MKFESWLRLLLLSVILANSGCQKPNFQRRYVTAKDGLIVRSEPRAGSAKIAVLPFDSAVEIDLNASAKPEKIANFDGFWRPYKHKDAKRGDVDAWVYDGFLSDTSGVKRGDPVAIKQNAVAALAGMRSSGSRLEVSTHCLVPVSCALQDGCSMKPDCLHGKGDEYSFALREEDSGWHLTIKKPDGRSCDGSLQPFIDDWNKTPWQESEVRSFQCTSLP